MPGYTYGWHIIRTYMRGFVALRAEFCARVAIRKKTNRDYIEGLAADLFEDGTPVSSSSQKCYCC